MKKCFVIQPFDNDKFDKRYTDIIKPVIKKCGYSVYRVDKDASVIIPIESIEFNIRTCDFCIAEISTDNPNVWYELGFAMSCGKTTIMICSDERTTLYPFDIRHKFILGYKTKSPSDFKEMSRMLQERITSVVGSETLSEELSDAELLMLNVVAQSNDTPYQVTPKDKLIIGSDEEAITALNRLVKRGYIEYIYSVDGDNKMSSYYRVTERAEKYGYFKISPSFISGVEGHVRIYQNADV